MLVTELGRCADEITALVPLDCMLQWRIAQAYLSLEAALHRIFNEHTRQSCRLIHSY